MQLYLNNEALILKEGVNSSRGLILARNNKIIKDNFDETENEEGSFDKYLKKCAETMNGSSVEFIEVEDDIKIDVYDLEPLGLIEDLDSEKRGMLIDELEVKQ